MANLKKVLRGQTVTEQLDVINENVSNINVDLEKVVNNEAGYITENDIPVKDVNGKTGNVTLNAKDVGAFPNSSTIMELDINNIKETGVYIGTYASNPYYLVVIRYNDTNIYQELIGLNFKEYRRFTNNWSSWIRDYSSENPVKAGDITGINVVDTDKELTLALLEDTTFVKANIKYNPSTNSLYVGDEKFATESFVKNAVNTVKSIIVTELPEIGTENTIYFVPNSSDEGNNIFNEYIYVNGKWEIIGGTSIDLTPFLTIDNAEKTYAKISSLDEKVSKTTTINGKTLYNNITLTAEDVGALPSNTKLVDDVVYRHTNTEIATKLTAGEFIENDVVLAIDDGNYKKGHFYKYNSGALTDITDIITDYVGLSNDQSIGGTKNFTGTLRVNGVGVANIEDLETIENKIPTIDTTLSTTSTNPVENKAITNELNKKALQSDLEELSETVDLKANTSYVDDELEKKQDSLTETQLSAVNSGVNISKLNQINQNITDLQTNKVDKITGKSLSTNDYTTEEKNKLASLSNYDDTNITNRVSIIEDKIPTTASSTNKLTDTNFVNSSIATNTATFKGTYNTLAELQSVTADVNDYGFVISTDSLGNRVFKRYKYSDGSWVFEYDLNNSSFTQEQWSSINSGATKNLIEKISGNEANINNLNLNKTDKTTTEALTSRVTTVETNISNLQSNKADKTMDLSQFPNNADGVVDEQYAKKKYVKEYVKDITATSLEGYVSGLNYYSEDVFNVTTDPVGEENKTYDYYPLDYDKNMAIKPIIEGENLPYDYKRANYTGSGYINGLTYDVTWNSDYNITYKYTGETNPAINNGNVSVNILDSNFPAYASGIIMLENNTSYYIKVTSQTKNGAGVEQELNYGLLYVSYGRSSTGLTGSNTGFDGTDTKKGKFLPRRKVNEYILNVGNETNPYLILRTLLPEYTNWKYTYEIEIKKATDNIETILNAKNYSTKSELQSVQNSIPNVSNFITKDVNNLTNYTLSTGVGSKLNLAIDSNTYVMTLSLTNASGTVLDTKTIDLPLETMVVDAGYDSTNKQIILTLKNGTTTSFSVADLVSGLATQSSLNTTNTNVTNLTTRVGTAETNITSLQNNKANKDDIPTVNNGTLTIQKNGTSVGTFTANQSSSSTINITVPTGEASDKGVVTTIDTSSNLPTSNAVKTFVEGKGYVTSSGSVASATKATQDGSGNNIVNTYATKSSLGTQATFSLSGTTLTITPK